MNSRYYMSFGVQYRYEDHPTLGRWAHPDGLILIFAPSPEIARRIATGLTQPPFGSGAPAYSMLYDEAEMTPEQIRAWFPRGVVATVSFDDGTVVPADLAAIAGLLNTLEVAEVCGEKIDYPAQILNLKALLAVAINRRMP